MARTCACSTGRQDGHLVELTGIFAYDPGLRSGIFVAGGTPAPGGITGIGAGAGLSGGGSSGAVTLRLQACPSGQVLEASGPGWACAVQAASLPASSAPETVSQALAPGTSMEHW